MPPGQFDPSPVMTDPLVRDAFVDALRMSGVVHVAAAKTGVPRASLYRARRAFPSFAAAWDRALGQPMDGLEAVLLDRVINGVERRRYHGGTLIDTFREYPEKLAIVMLKAHLPETYGTARRGEVEDVAIVPLTREEIMTRIAAAQRTIILA